MKLTADKMDKFKDRPCFICGKDLLTNTMADLAYVPNAVGQSLKHKPERYFLFPCPNCSKVAHKRCWYNHGEKTHKKGFFSKEYRLECPGCGQILSPKRDKKINWQKGYEIPGHPDNELIEVHLAAVRDWRRGRSIGDFISRVGQAIETFFKAVGLGSLTDRETSAVARAAEKIGKGISDVAEKVFRLDISPEERSEIKELKCQNCGAPLPLPEYWEEAVVCSHCRTAHLLPT
ncbi:MAG: hypothetical protein ACFFED_12055 [Candidatus Thorarchaeota archaeon]